MNGLASKFKDRNFLLLFSLFLLFLSLRLFVSYDSILLGSDHLKFMEASRNFPNHTLANNQLYVHHAPLYPYAIHMIDLFVSDTYLASVLLSLLCAIISFFLVYKIMMVLFGSYPLSILALLFYSLSVEMAISAQSALRESFVVMLLLLCIYFFIRAMKFSDNGSLAFCTLFSAVLAFSSDHVIFLFPALGLTYLIFSKQKPSLWPPRFPRAFRAIIPLAIALLVFSIWLWMKANQYSSNEYYPAGYEGTPVKTEGFGILQLFDPHNFEDYTTTGGVKFGIKNIAYNLGYMYNLLPFEIPRGLNFTTMKFLLEPHHIALMAIIYLPLALLSLFGILKIAKETFSKGIYQNPHLYVLGLFILFTSPILYGASSPRYLYPAYIFLFGIIGIGGLESYRFISARRRAFFSRSLSLALLAMIAIGIPLWIFLNPYGVLSLNQEIGAKNTISFVLENVPADSVIMAQPGYSYKLTYLTPNNVVGLYPLPEKLSEVIDHYGVSYVVVGRYYTKDAYHLAEASVNYVMSHPEEFERITTIKEDYSAFFSEKDPARSDEVYIFKVKR